MGVTVCWVLGLFYFRDFAIVKFNSRSNFVIEHFRRTDFSYSVIATYLFIGMFGGGGGFTRPISGDGGADQFRGVPVIGQLPTDGTRGPE